MKSLFFILTFIFLTTISSIASDLKLTDQEQKWLDVHPEISIALDSTTPPQCWSRDGELQGIDVDMVALLNERLGGQLKIVTGLWPDIYKGVTEKKLDAIMYLTPSKERETYFNFTKPYMSIPHVIVAKKSGKHYLNISSLKNDTITLIKSTFLEAYFNSIYPNINVLLSLSHYEALKKVQCGDAKAYILPRNIANLLLQKHQMGDLGIHGQSTETSETNVIGVRKDWPFLAKILNKTLASIPYERILEITSEHNKIKNEMATIKLTDEEKMWINNNSEIIVGASMDWAPYDFWENDNAAGFSNDYISLLAQKAGLNISFRTGYSWIELLEKMKRKEIDLLPMISLTKERKSYISFTEPYLHNSDALLVNNKDRHIKTIEDMFGKSIGVIAGFSQNEGRVKKYPKINFVEFKSALEAITAVSSGDVDGYIDFQGTINYYRREHQILDVVVVNSDVFSTEIPLHIGVQRGNEILRDILSKAIKEVNRSEVNHLKNIWFGESNNDIDSFHLASSEKILLSTLPQLTIGSDNSWGPFEFNNKEGDQVGITSEYLSIIEKKLDLDFTSVSGNWSSIYSKVQDGSIDILSGAVNTEERQNDLSFTKPYLSIPVVIGTKIKSPFISQIEDLNGKKVGQCEGYAIKGMIQKDHPKIEFVDYNNIEEVMKALSRGDIDATLMNTTSFTYQKNRLGLESKVHINNVTNYNVDLSVGLQHKYSELIPIFNHIFDHISPEEKDLMVDKWTNQQIHKFTDWKMVWLVTGFFSLLLLFFLFWNYKMSSEIEKRKVVEARLKEDEKHLKEYADTQAILLREVNHRVKNNLSAIIGMLHMEEDRVGSSKPDHHAFNEVERRIKSLLVVHSMLSNSKWEPLRLTDICEQVIWKNVDGTLGRGKYDLKVEPANVRLNSDNTHSFALVLSELATNSSKYAVRKDARLEISIKVSLNDTFVKLVYSDNGPGFAEIMEDKKSGLGMTIIKGVVTGNLGGTLKQFNDNGAVTQIIFPVEEETQLIEENLL